LKLSVSLALTSSIATARLSQYATLVSSMSKKIAVGAYHRFKTGFVTSRWNDGWGGATNSTPAKHTRSK
jgi:hypothetical protein